MRYQQYVAVVEQYGEERFVSLPDFPEVGALRIEAEDAYTVALQAARSAADVRRASGEPLPSPTPVEKYAFKRRPNVRKSVFCVPVPVMRAWTRVNIVMEPTLLSLVDDEAQQRGMTRSSYIAHAMREKLVSEERAAA